MKKACYILIIICIPLFIHGAGAQEMYLAQLDDTIKVKTIISSPNGEKILITQPDNTFIIFDKRTFKPLLTGQFEPGTLDTSFDWNPDNNHIALISVHLPAILATDGLALTAVTKVVLFNTARKTQVGEPILFNLAADRSCWSPDGTTLALSGTQLLVQCPDTSTTPKGTLALYNFWTKKKNILTTDEDIVDCVWSPDSSRIATASRGQMQSEVFDSEDLPIFSLTTSRGQRTYTNPKIKVWKIDDGSLTDMKLFESSKYTQKDVVSCSWSDRGHIATLSHTQDGSTISIWGQHIKQKTPLHKIKTSTHPLEIRWAGSSLVISDNTEDSDGIIVLEPLRKKPRIVDRVPFIKEMASLLPNINNIIWNTGEANQVVAVTDTGQLLIDDRRIPMTLIKQQAGLPILHALAYRMRTGHLPSYVQKLKTPTLAHPRAIPTDKKGYKRKRGQ